MAEYSDAESEALLKSLGHQHGNEDRAQTVARLQAAIKFAGHAKADSAPVKRPKRTTKR